jgi:hypothetical protein
MDVEVLRKRAPAARRDVERTRATNALDPA